MLNKCSCKWIKLPASLSLSVATGILNRCQNHYSNYSKETSGQYFAMTKYKIVAVYSKFHPQFHLYLKITFFGVTSYLFISHYITLVTGE